MYNNINNKKEKGIGSRLFKTNNMCTFIKMEYLVANALVFLYEKNNIDQISLEQIKEYGIKVEEVLNSEGDTKAILLYSNQYTKEFLQDYSEWFELIDDKVKIKQGVTISDIREHILSYVSVDVLVALLNKTSLSVLKAA